MIVYIVEHKICFRETRVQENVVMHVASTEAKAIEWCKKNTNIEEKKDDKPWWFAISSEEVDASSLDFSDIIFLDWNGNRIQNQPLDGYN